MEREILLTGIGGQGIQLAARTLAGAAIDDGRRVQLVASYGGMMRGGNSDSTLVIADEEVTAPPMVTTAWAAFVMHPAHAEPAWANVRAGGLAVVNSSLIGADALPVDRGFNVLEVPAFELATELGAPVAASLVLAGALVAHTAVVSPDALLAAASHVLPSYRAEAAEVNRRALEVGLAHGSLVHPAWEPDRVQAGAADA